MQTYYLKQINNNLVKRHIDYLGNLRVIIFSPDDIRLLKDSPGNRRRFLNIELSQLYDKYVKLLSEFNIVLKQRNEYLKIIKNGNFNLDYYNILNDKYVDLAVSIYLYRYNYIEMINEYIDYFDIEDKEINKSVNGQRKEDDPALPIVLLLF